ncbi:MAG: serine/threonine-protein kinase PknK [Cyanothece sp. SIO1E1]|nr:serine/threonine-protein kinase PknK [Cyanothece sp. SIO1E1]
MIAKTLNSPGIVQPISLEHYGNGFALIMPDEGHVSLKQAISSGQLGPVEPHQPGVDLSTFFKISLQLAQSLGQLYQHRVIHKDIKPTNILIHPDSQQVKLIDFSIASLLPKETQVIQNPNTLEGSLAYLAPEQTGRMNRGIDYRADFYGLGVTLYELLTGQLPFQLDDPLALVHCHLTQAPMPPHQVNSTIPPVVSAIILKLMAKNAEERYQSALGLKHDLAQCWSQWQQTGAIAEFELGQRDVSDRFLIPEKLYGREVEVRALLDAFDRVAAGRTEVMLVAGFSGIGKTAVVNEVHKPITRQQGYFIKGKFDQFNRNIPFSAFVQAFRSLMGQLLSESDADLAQWQTRILAAVEDNGQVIIEVIPELACIIGQQPPVPELSGSAAQNRFNLLFGKFVRVFAAKTHPLVIFLDDLQWADSASLNLLKLLMDESETDYLLVLGAYRDNEVFPVHPLMLTLDHMQKWGANINTLTLTALSEVDIARLVADTLLCSVDLAAPLSQLVYQKTQGNPFFTTQFLQGLHGENCIHFEAKKGYWLCDLAQVRQLALTNDVVEFMVGRLHKLPEATQVALNLAACIGNRFDLATLAVVCEGNREQVATDLWPALQEGFVVPESETYKFFQGEQDPETNPESVLISYRFLHDRVQQAAYALMPEEQKQTTHYHIGQLLLQKTPADAQEDRIFELVNQLNYGIGCIPEQTERDQLAQLNLIACRKARAATAYQAGRAYASTGLLFLGERAWQRQYEMSLAFHDLAAELASLCGDLETMTQLIETVIEQAHTLLEKINVYRIQIQSKASQNQLTAAIAVARQCLQQLGIIFPDAPTQNEIQAAIAEINELISDREITEFVHLPLMTDGEKIAIIQIANSIIPATYMTGSPLFSLVVALSVKLSIQCGNTSASAFAYACYGLITCGLLQDVNTGVKFGELACQLVSKLDARAVKPEVLNVVATFILHHKSHIKTVLPLLQEGYAAALEVGNLECVGYTAQGFCRDSFWCNRPLATLAQEIRAYCNGLEQLHQLTSANWCRIHWQARRC